MPLSISFPMFFPFDSPLLEDNIPKPSGEVAHGQVLGPRSRLLRHAAWSAERDHPGPFWVKGLGFGVKGLGV